MRSPTPARNLGFTLYELMLTLALAAVLAAFAAPNMRDFLRNNRLTAVGNDLLRSMQVARSEAIKRQRSVAVCASADPAAATPACSFGNFNGWVVFEDANGDWQVSSGEEIIERHDLVHDSVTVLNDNDGIFSYAPSGFPNPAGAKVPVRNIVVCDVRGNQPVGDNSTARAVLIEATGRLRVTRSVDEIDDAMDETGSCPS